MEVPDNYSQKKKIKCEEVPPKKSWSAGWFKKDYEEKNEKKCRECLEGSLRYISVKYRELSEEQKDIYKERAKADRARYDAEMAEFKDATQVLPKKQPNARKKQKIKKKKKKKESKIMARKAFERLGPFLQSF